MNQGHEQSQPGQVMPAAPPQHVLAFREEWLDRILVAIERRADLIGALHTLSPAQQDALKVFDSFVAGMAVRGEPPVPRRDPVHRSPDGSVLMFPVPPEARRARIFSAAGLTSLDDPSQVRNYEGYMPIPESLRHTRIGRVEFYDGQGVLIALAGAEREPVPGQRELARRL
jgi:hypothetical protein